MWPNSLRLGYCFYLFFFFLVAKEDHSDADCFVCVILSHGTDGHVYGTNGRVSLDSLIKPFKGDECPSLAGKPKLFFVQVRTYTVLTLCTTVCFMSWMCRRVVGRSTTGVLKSLIRTL